MATQRILHSTRPATRRSRMHIHQWISVAAIATVAMAATSVDAWVAPIVAKGNKYFNSETGEEFRIKGMAYYPRPNAGEFATVGNYDWAADDYEDIWMPHLEVMKDLGVNTIRLYSVDPSRPHDKFMCACSNAGIYVIIGMTAPCMNCSVMDAEPPACYPDELYERIQMVYNAMAVYDNTLGFSVGNENNLQIKYGKNGTTTAPCVKALLRDTRAYAASCERIRQVPIGLDIADIPPREQWLQYYDCVVDDDENTRADWIGFNPYVECNPRKNKEYSDSAGLQELMKVYDDVGYARPLMFGEFGCNEGENTIDGFENQRGFYDAKWMNEEAEMTEQIVGGNVFEFTTELANLVGEEKKLSKEKNPGKFGVGYFMPEDCDHKDVPCIFTPYPEYENLKAAFTSTKKSTVTMDSFTPSRSREPLTCPTTISTDLPTTPQVERLPCSYARPVCGGSTTRPSSGSRGSGSDEDDEDAGSTGSKTNTAATCLQTGALAIVVAAIAQLLN